MVARHNLKDEDESKKENLDDNIAQPPSSLTPLVYYRLSVDVHYSSSGVGGGPGGGAGGGGSSSGPVGKMSAVVLVKKGGVAVMEAEKSLQSQVKQC